MKNIRIVTLFTLVIFNLYYFNNKNEEVYERVNLNEPIVVQLEGEVIFPGSYYFYQPITLKEVISFAGGFTNDADKNLDLNKIISKNTVININKIKEEIIHENILININKATFSELLQIPNITELRAANIIIYREQYGKFNSIEELLNVKYIGEATFEKVKKYITI